MCVIKGVLRRDLGRLTNARRLLMGWMNLVGSTGDRGDGDVSRPQRRRCAADVGAVDRGAGRSGAVTTSRRLETRADGLQ